MRRRIGTDGDGSFSSIAFGPPYPGELELLALVVVAAGSIVTAVFPRPEQPFEVVLDERLLLSVPGTE